MLLLVGDNPFQGVSHLSQERARARGLNVTNPEYAAKLIEIATENGADGFMFSINDTSLSILRVLKRKGLISNIQLYAITPAAYQYVRLMGPMGGLSNIGKEVLKQISLSRNFKAITFGLKGAISTDPLALMKAFLHYEISRIKCFAGKQATLNSIMLHEIITDLASALGLNWLFDSYIEFVKDLGITPGFETRNFAHLIYYFRRQKLSLNDVEIAAPFNKIGFQMNPSKNECEEALAHIPKPNVIAISILAAGYLKPTEAIDYIKTLPKIKGVAVGISKEKHAYETFKLFKEIL